MNFIQHKRRQLLAAIVTFTALGLSAALAQTPATLRVILPVGPGSGVDTIVRAAQPALSKALGQVVVIENMPGAGGITGTTALVKATPDGNTVAFISNNHSVNPSVFKNLPYDSLNDITPISVVGGSPFVLVVNPQNVAAKTAKEFQTQLKAKPSTFNMGSSGNGTILHLAGEMFVDAAGAEVIHVPYKGVGPMLTDLMAGQIDFGVSAVAAVQGHIASGRIRPLAVMSKTRVPSLPNVPTFIEQGFPDVEVNGWFAFIGPAKLPAAQVKRLHTAVVAAFNDPAVKESMAKQENFINPTSPEGAAKFLKTEQERYAKLVAKAQIKLD